MSRLSDLGRSALYYAEKLGWSVFPLKPRDKIPLVPKTHGGQGVKDATRDRRIITDWWRRHPEANVGIACGVPSGIWVLDVDPRNGGDDSLSALIGQHDELPGTVEAITGSGGRHLLWSFDEAVDGTIKCIPIAAGLDVKSTGGYIVAAPSIHPNGLAYVWEASSRPNEVQVIAAPDWLRAMLHRSRGAGRVGPGAAPATDDPRGFYLGQVFARYGWLGHEVRPGVWAVRCPLEHLHTTGYTYDSSTVIFAPNTEQAKGWKKQGFFLCSHGHCSFLRNDLALVVRAVERAAERELRGAG